VQEFEEHYGIDRSTASLAAVMEAQYPRRAKFDKEMSRTKDQLSLEIAYNTNPKTGRIC